MKNYFDLSGKVAIISGASSGIGAHVAKVFASQGASVVLLARRYEKLALKASQLESDCPGITAVPLRCDVTNEKNVKSAVDYTIKKFGKIDILLNVAGAADGLPLHMLREPQWQNVIDTNLKSVYLLSKYALYYMIRKRSGRIINVASILGAVGCTGMATHSYNAAKGAVISLTRGMAAYYGRFGITVNAIGPGLFYSEMTSDTLFKEPAITYYRKNCPLGREGHKDELDSAFLYFASDASSYTTGQTLMIDGGWTSV